MIDNVTSLKDISLCHQVVELSFDSCDNAANDPFPEWPLWGEFRSSHVASVEPYGALKLALLLTWIALDSTGDAAINAGSVVRLTSRDYGIG